MPSQAIAEGLDSRNPRERVRAIKQIARAGAVDMLPALQTIAEQDDDEQVRTLASRAIVFMNEKAGAPVPEGHIQNLPRPQVSSRDEARAKGFLDNAIGYQINNERDKALKELAKARNANPALEDDPFFRNVLDEVTGTSGDDSLSIVRSPDQIKEIESEEKRRKTRQVLDEHQNEVKRSTWSSALMDLTIYTFILVFATLFLPIVVSQSANNFIAQQQAAQQEYADAVAAGEQNVRPPAAVDPDFADFVATAQESNLSMGVILGLVAGIGGLIGLLLNLSLVHVVARFLFHGDATFPHLIYKVVSFYNGRLPILYGLLYLGIVATFIFGGGVISLIFSGLAGLFSLIIAFKVIGRVGEAYHFGFLKAFLSMIAAGVVLAILGVIVQLLAFSALVGLLQSTMA